MVRFHAFSIFTGSQEPTPTQKQTSMKRIFTFLFALLSACTFSAYAAIVDGTCGDNLTWTLNTKDSTLTISGTGEMTTSYPAPWYDYRSYIKYVTLPDGLTSIGGEAFRECSGLTSITIPNSVTSIGSSAFENCSSLTSVTLGNSVTSIEYYAFYGCSSLTSVTIPNSVTSIGIQAFTDCSSLTSVTIGNSVTNVGARAFEGCTGLTSVTIGNSVTSIGSYTFQNCSSLTSITIPNSVTSIGGHAFAYCSGLTSVTLGSGVTSIGAYAFRDCTGLTSITIPNSVTSIGEMAFYGCSGFPVENNLRYADTYLVEAVDKTLSTYSIKEGTKWIGSYAFSDCTGLTSITIPNSVTSIGERAFDGCDGLTSPIYNTHCFAYMPCSYKGAYIIPEGIKQIAGGAFKGCSGLTSITIPNSVTSIGGYAFYECSSLTSITIPDRVTSIGGYAFEFCESLTSIAIPNSVTSIGTLAFAYCSGLTSVTLGSGVTSIGYATLKYCDNIQELTAYMPIPPSAAGCGLNQTSCTLYVPAEYLEAYQNAEWWEDFKEIRAIVSNWDVEFVDWDGSILATMKVPDGEAATAPADPTREGYTFIGWDKDFSSVTEDMTITALYQINRYGVRFYDWDDTLLKIDSVDYQSAATAPADPTREGYTFIGWDKDFSSITADLDVYAQYEAGADKEFEVIFSDQDDNELSAQTVTLRVPLAPQIAGFTFLYWLPVAEPVEDVITLQAVYGSDTPTEAPEVYVNPSNPAQKLIRNGQVYILHEEKMYTISGQVVK